jgi:hypothetical protein
VNGRFEATKNRKLSQKRALALTHDRRFNRLRTVPTGPVTRAFSVIIGKVPASALALHPISLPRAVNDSFQARISGGRMTQSGRYE